MRKSFGTSNGNSVTKACLMMLLVKFPWHTCYYFVVAVFEWSKSTVVMFMVLSVVGRDAWHRSWSKQSTARIFPCLLTSDAKWTGSLPWSKYMSSHLSIVLFIQIPHAKSKWILWPYLETSGATVLDYSTTVIVGTSQHIKIIRSCSVGFLVRVRKSYTTYKSPG